MNRADVPLMGGGPAVERLAKPGEPVTRFEGVHSYTMATPHGLTIREHFAALAMQGLLSNPSIFDGEGHCSVAQLAKKCAEALLFELAISELARARP